MLETLPPCTNCIARLNPFAIYFDPESRRRADAAPVTLFSNDNGPRFACRVPICPFANDVLCLRCLVSLHKDTPGHTIEQLDMTTTPYQWVQTQVLAQAKAQAKAQADAQGNLE